MVVLNFFAHIAMFEHILFDILFIFIMVSDFMFLQGMYMWVSCTAFILIVPSSFFFFFFLLVF